MNTFELVFTGGDSKTLPGGKQFLLLEANSDVTIQFFDSYSKPMEKAEGLKGGFRTRFSDRFLSVKITSASAQTILVGITDGDAEYNRMTGSLSADISGTTFEHGTSVDIAATTSALICAANSDRREIVVTSDAGNGDTVYLGGTGVGDQEGIPLEPGDDFTLSTQGAIYGYNSDAASAKLLFAEIE